MAARTASATQIATTTIAAARPEGLPPDNASADRARHSSSTSAGIKRIAIQMPAGTRTRSSRKPSTGMKSGMRSMGLTA